METHIQIPLKNSQEVLKTIPERNGYRIVKTENIRSSVYNSNGKLVAFSPLSSCDIDTFFDSNGKLLEHIRIEEYVEGTMINLFYDNNIWNISTKSTVGGKNNFYINGSNKQKTFYEMFHECWKDQNLGDINSLSKKYSYSFVMQHKDNRIINKVFNNRLVLIAMYLQDYEDNLENGEIKTNVSMIYDEKVFEVMRQFGFEFPVVSGSSDCYDTKEKLIQEFASPYTDYSIMGINLFNTKTGERSKLRNPAYEELKKLRGNQAKIEYHYMTLRKLGKVDEFLDFFPEYQEDFNMYECKIINYQHELLDEFNKCYIKRKHPLGKVSLKYRNHMFALSQQYKSTNLPTTMDTVIDYINNIHEAQLMSCVNYEYRPINRVNSKHNMKVFNLEQENFPALSQEISGY